MECSQSERLHSRSCGAVVSAALSERKVAGSISMIGEFHIAPMYIRQSLPVWPPTLKRYLYLYTLCTMCRLKPSFPATNWEWVSVTVGPHGTTWKWTISIIKYMYINSSVFSRFTLDSAGFREQRNGELVRKIIQKVRKICASKEPSARTSEVHYFESTKNRFTSLSDPADASEWMGNTYSTKSVPKELGNEEMIIIKKKQFGVDKMWIKCETTRNQPVALQKGSKAYFSSDDLSAPWCHTWQRAEGQTKTTRKGSTHTRHSDDNTYRKYLAIEKKSWFRVRSSWLLSLRRCWSSGGGTHSRMQRVEQ